MKETSNNQIRIIERFDEVILEKASKHTVREMEAQILGKFEDNLESL